MKKAIVFDFDGVLGDTWESSIQICRELNMDFTLDDYRDHHNGNVYEKPKLKFTEDSANEFFRIYEERASGDKLFPLKSELEKISQNNDIFVISSNKETAIGKYFALGEWGHFFKKIYGVETDKSKTKKFAILFDEFNLKPEDCIFVTDTLGDLLEGGEIGVRTLAVTWGYHGEMRLREGEPTKVIHEFSDLAMAIEGM